MSDQDGDCPRCKGPMFRGFCVNPHCRIAGLEDEVERLEALLSGINPEPETISALCRRTQRQNCHICEDADCGDNTNPSIVRLKDQLAHRELEISKLYGQSDTLKAELDLLKNASEPSGNPGELERE